MGTVQIDGSTPKITVGNATAEDATILFDGNAQDFYIALDDSADDLLIGLGSTVGTTPAISIDENLQSTFGGDVIIGGATPTLTIGDAGAEDTKIVFDGNAQDFHIGLDDSSDDLVIGLGSTLGTTSHIVIDETGAVTKPLQPAFLVRPASTQSDIAINGNIDVVFGTEVFDVNADFSAPYFTAPVTGKYSLNVGWMLDQADASAYWRFDLITSNNSFYHYHLDSDVWNADGYHAFTASYLVDMDASDTAYVRIYQAGGAQQTDIRTDSWFSGHLAC